MITRLSHTELSVHDLDAAERFYVHVLGFTLAQRTDDALYLRAAEEFDQWSLKLSAGPSALRWFGFRVASADALEALAADHRALGATVTELAAGHEPGLGRGLRITTPDGFCLHLVHDVEEVSLSGADGVPRHPMRNAHAAHGVPPARIHHVNLKVLDPDRSLRYWGDRLGFSTSERVVDANGSTRLAWIRRSHSTHDVALGRADGIGMHHLAFAVAEPAAVMRVCDVLADGGYADAIEFGPGRHGVTNAMTVYAFDPSGHRIEFFAGDYVRDHDRPPLTWTADAYAKAGRLWWGPLPPASFLEHASAVEAPEPVTAGLEARP